MKHEESMDPADWIRIAKEDLARVDVLLSAENPVGAGFYLQQAVEKFLKAFLLSKGWDLERSHDLQALLNQALERGAPAEPYRALCQRISGFYIAERYPLIVPPELTAEDVQECLDQVQGLIELLREGIKE